MTPAPVAPSARKRRARASGIDSFPVFATLVLLTAVQGARAEDPTLVRETREVSVTATRGERNLLDVPANVSVIDRAAIERTGATSVPELLRREAGVFVTNTTTNPEGFGLEARGFQNGGGNGCRTLVLVDGRRANEPDTGCADWTFIPLENVERIEVVRGTGSAIYGDNAIGGVIQIFTRKPSEGTRASLGLGGGSYDTEHADAAASTAFGALSVGLFAAYDDTEGFRNEPDETTLGDGFSGSSHYNAKRVQADLGYDLDDLGRVGLAGGYASTERSRPGALFTEYADRDGENGGPNFDQGRERERFVQGVIELNLPAEISLRAVPFYRRARSRNAFESPFFAFGSRDRQIMGGLDLQLSRDFELARLPVRLIGGVEVRGEDFDTTSTFASNEADRRVLGVFTQAELTLAEAWLLSAGVRYDDSDLEGVLSAPLPECPALRCDFDDEEWSPRVALTWRFADPGAVYASYSEGFRFPNLNEAFGSYGFAPALKPERSKGFELGAKWSGERWRGNAAFYQMRVDDEIFFDPLAPNPLNPFFDGINTNVDEVRHRGAELSASYQVLEWLELYAAYTFDDVEVREDSRVAFEGEQLPITPKHRGNVGVRATLPLGFEASVHASYVGERRLVNDVEPPADFLPSYATYDARVAWRRELADGVALLLEANGRNLTNRHYAEWGGISSFSGVGYWPSPERNFSASARITFER
jgi:iron complex outermembrane receptor protein